MVRGRSDIRNNAWTHEETYEDHFASCSALLRSID